MVKKELSREVKLCFGRHLRSGAEGSEQKDKVRFWLGSVFGRDKHCLVLHDPESFPVSAHRRAILIGDRMLSSSRVQRSSGRRVNECQSCTACVVSCSEKKERHIAPLCVTSSTGRLSFTQNRTREPLPRRHAARCVLLLVRTRYADVGQRVKHRKNGKKKNLTCLSRRMEVVGRPAHSVGYVSVGD